MVRYLTWLLLVLAISSVSIGTVAGQEFRVYTKVYDRSVGSDAKVQHEGAPIVARSLSLFRAGKAYDYLPSIGEVIIFEPARPHRRFTILNTMRNVATTVTFDELNGMLKVAREQTESGLAELRSNKDPAVARALESLAFQLQPNFEETFAAAERRLMLVSPTLRYTAACETPSSPEALEAYLRYADWICRLNYVLHPGLLLPEPRVALNEALRRHGVMPVAVELQADLDARIHLKAEHEIEWALLAKDRSLIHDWETQLKSPTIERVTIHEYQRAVLVSFTTDRRK